MLRAYSGSSMKAPHSWHMVDSMSARNKIQIGHVQSKHPTHYLSSPPAPQFYTLLPKSIKRITRKNIFVQSKHPTHYLSSPLLPKILYSVPKIYQEKSLGKKILEVLKLSKGL